MTEEGQSASPPAASHGVDSISRRRAKKACEPCKLRKRRCDGKEPCNSCLRYEYECYFVNRRHPKKSIGHTTLSAPPQQASPLSSQPVAASVALASPTDARSNGPSETSMEANSGVVSPHILGLKLDASSAFNVRGFGWNLGIHYRQPRSDKSMIWIISKAEWQSLFDVYLQKIHSLYGFLDTSIVISKSSRRWEDPCATNTYDHVLCGVAALALLFSPGASDDREHHLVECAKEILESVSTVRDPTVHDAQAWLLRTMYLRCTSPPHATWMASCSTMHIVEATGLHQESEDVSLVYLQAESIELNVECRRRTFWIAKLFNTWVSFEYGRSRVVLQNTSCQMPTAIQGDFTADLMSMFVCSEILDPARDGGSQEFEAAFWQVEALDHGHEALTLSQCNLCFALYRRLRLAQTNVKSAILDKVITVGRKGLEAALRATRSGSPWWHVSNVPFQFVCILLAMDTKESFTHVNQAISTLRMVAAHFNTSMVQKALSTVESLVRFSQKRKEEDAVMLQASLSQDLSPESFQRNLESDLVQPPVSSVGLGWPNNDLWKTSNLGNVNWDQFWIEPLNFGTSTLPRS